MTEKLKILFLAANTGAETRAGREAREISRRLRDGPHRAAFNFILEPNIRARDLEYVLLLHEPHVLHFSGRGDKKTGILLADDFGSPHPVDNKALIRLFKILKGKLRVLVFNACYTKQRASGLARTFDYTIGMKDTLDDESAINFSESFYQALGFGRTVVEAFGLGCIRLGLEGRATANQPFLLRRQGLDTSLPLLQPAAEEGPQALAGLTLRQPNAQPIELRPESVVQSELPDSPIIERSLIVPERTWDPNFNPPAALLRADFRVVPFFGRAAELEVVETWTNCSAPISVLLVTGRGGSGKTRFAVEVCLRAKQQELAAGFFSHSPLGPSMAQLFQAARRPVLAVIDYAEEQHMQLPSLLQALIAAARAEVTTFRLLLLARNAGEWWTLLKSTQGEVSELLQSKATQRLRLGPIATNSEEARVTYQAAFDAFCIKIGLAANIGHNEPITELSREALLIHTQALLRALGEEQCPREEAEVFDFLLNRERGFWLRQLTAHRVDIALLPIFETIVAAITLRGGVQNADHTDEIITEVRARYGLDAITALNLRSILRDTYGDGCGIEPLQPDLLGEHLLAQHMNREIEDLASRS